MAYRDPEQSFPRFREFDEALNQDRGWFESTVFLRYAAIAALRCNGSPSDVARQVREIAQALKKDAGWFGQLTTELRYVVAAILLQRGDDAPAFTAELVRAKTVFRVAGIRRDAIYEILSVLAMRSYTEHITDSHVHRLKQFYEEMKKYHWWLTGPDDLPALALLTSRDEPVGLIAQRIEQICDGLHAEGFAKCSELQYAAHLLYHSRERAELAAARAGVLFRQFKEQGKPIRRGDYDLIAMLTLLEDEAQKIAEQSLSYRDQARTLRPRSDKQIAFDIGTNLAALKFLPGKGELTSASQSLIVQDIQNVIVGQRTAAIIMAAA